MSRRTEKSYIHYILDYIYFHNKKHPEDMGVEEIRTYLSHLATDRKVAASTQNFNLPRSYKIKSKSGHLD